MKVYDIYLNKKLLERVYYSSDLTDKEVKTDLIETDGYNPDIEIEFVRDEK